VIYVEQIEPLAELRILISDRRQPNEENTVVAKRGTLVANEDIALSEFPPVRRRHLHQPRRRQGYHKTDFSVYDVSLNLSGHWARWNARARPERDPAGRAAKPGRGLRADGEQALASGSSLPAVSGSVRGARLRDDRRAARLQPVRAVCSRAPPSAS
jgi:hypothetical protein